MKNNVFFLDYEAVCQQIHSSLQVVNASSVQTDATMCTDCTVISRAPASDTEDSLSRHTSLSQMPYHHRLHYSSASRVNVGEMSLPTSPGLRCLIWPVV